MFEKNENKRKISRGWLAGVACFENLARRKSHYFKMQNELLVRQTFHGFDPKVCRGYTGLERSALCEYTVVSGLAITIFQLIRAVQTSIEIFFYSVGRHNSMKRKKSFKKFHFCKG